MEIQKFTIRRTTASATTWSLPCTGGTNFYPINLSTNCSGITMYNSTGSQVLDALDSGVMSSFPNELRDCSPSEPCVILWNAPLGTSPTNCTNTDGYNYVSFKGLILTSGGTYYQNSYNELITIYDVTNTNLNQTLSSQGINAFWDESIEICNCLNPLDSLLYKIPLTLTQDYNDIGHYSIWDGRIDQQQTFSNFVFTANTTGNGMLLQIYNTTNFGQYKEFQKSPYTINWGECDCSIPNNSLGFPCCEDLQYPSLTSQHEYVVPSQYSVKITHNGPWGPTSVSQTITVPNLTYNQILAQPFSSAPPTGAGMGGASVGAGVALSPTTPGGDPYQVNLTGPNPIPGVYPPPLFTSTAYHGTYGTLGSLNYYPLDSGTNINQYSGTSIGCFELTGITDSSVGIFSTYSNLPSTTAPGFLPNGFETFVSLPVGGDVIDPITGTITAGMVGEIFAANAAYTGYTISSANGQTPIDFYDFPNGITIFVATSCGLNSLAFGGEDCFECPEETCEFCLTKDEYIDRVTLQPQTISPNSPANPPNWSPFVDYVKGDIVYDVSPQDCCCYVAVTDITQTSNTGLNSPFAGLLPSQLYQGVWLNPSGGTDVHVWEGCTPDCISCPPGSALPCADPYNIFNAYSPMGPVGVAGEWNSTQVFTTGQFIYGPDGNCYQSLTNVPSGVVPTAMTNSTMWDYVGCVSWVCPQDLANPGPYVCELISGSTPNSFTFYAGPGGCLTEYNNGNCPVDDRWHCSNQYGCDMPGCTQIDYSHPQYNNPGYPFSVTFSSMTDCEQWCNPLAYSCTTPTSTPCCSEVSCFTLPNSDYYDIMTNYVLTTPQLTANINQLFLDPYYDLSDCELGVSSQGISACCNFTSWEYFCDQGCVEIVGGGFPDEISCQTAPGNNSGAPGPCGWDCYDPWNQPCSGGTGFPGSSACVPCFTNGCGLYTTSGDCCNWCVPPLTSCWVCLSGASTPCQNLAPCPTPLPAWEADWYTDPALVPLSGFGANPNFSNFTYPDGSYSTAQLCDDNCPTEGGFDCLEHMGNGTSYGQCVNWPNPVALPSGYAWSPGGPYDSFSACCLSTGCCDVECDESAQIFDPFSGLYDPSWPFWPCVFIASIGANTPSPTGPVYFTMAQCTADNPTGCVSDEITCDCACDPLTGGQGNDQEEWTNLTGDYTLYDYVSYPGGTPSTCCYYCDLPIYSNPYSGPPSGFYDCNYFVPEGPDAPNGIPNPWISCGSTPSGATTGGCDPCSAPSADTYSCDYIDGCVLNAVPCNFVLGQETALNCYTASTCQDECKAGCYCDDNNTPTDVTDDFTACVMLQDVLNGLTTNTSTWYGFISLWACQQMILLPPPINLDCCTVAGTKFHCDDSDWCSSLNPGIPGTNGLGCIEVFAGDPLYNIAAYTNLTDCQQNCKWACDVASTLGTCQFVGNNPLGLFPEHSSAYDCYQNTNMCDCTTPGLWFCDTNAGQSATTSNCFQENVIQGWQGTSPFVGWTDNLVFGQGGTSTPYSSGVAIGFASQSDCQQACRFCCDDVVSCTCDLNPYNFSCSISIQDCINSQTTYPCCPLITEWCCDELLGCVSFVGSMPASCVHGPFANPSDCQDECNFLCGECTPDLGSSVQPDPCHCSLITTPFYTASPPYTNCTAFNNMVDCETNAYGFGGVGSNTTTCCPCQDCQVAGSVTYPIFQSNTWSLQTTPINLPPTGSIISSDPWDPTIAYLSGDTVTHCDSGGTCCCYVNVMDGYDLAYQGLQTPSYWYNTYANYLANNQTTILGDPLVWIPCDTSCPTTASTLAYECIPGQPIYTVCSNATMEFPINPVGTGGFGVMGINAGTSTWNWPHIFFDWIVQTYPPNTPFLSKKAVSPNGGSWSCPNPDPNQYGGAGGVFRTTPHCHSSNIIYTTANGCPQSVTFIDWNDAIAQLNLVNANLSLPQTFNTGMSVQDAKTEMTNYGETNVGLFAGTSSCQCAQIGPCTCIPCTFGSGPNCVYPDMSTCMVAANANPCCVPPVTGFWVCDTGNPNPQTGVCPCIFDPNAIVGYNNINTCTADTSTCCYVSGDRYLCVQSGATSSAWTGYDTYINTQSPISVSNYINHLTLDAVNDATYLSGIFSTGQISAIQNAGYFSNPGTALQTFLLKQRALGYTMTSGPAGLTISPYNTEFINYVGGTIVDPYGTQPGLQQSPDCFRETNLNNTGSNTYRLVETGLVFHNPDVNAGWTYDFLTFMGWVQACVTPATWSGGPVPIYSPTAGASGNPNYTPDGYLIFLSQLTSKISQDSNTPCTSPGCTNSVVAYCMEVESTPICQAPCTCIVDNINGNHPSQIACEQDPTNCCDPYVTPSWDCNPLNYTCYDPGTGLGAYSSLNSCQTNCNPPLIGCDDCNITLAGQFVIGANYVGMFDNSTTYQLDECVYDPSDADCCYCCVPYTVGPASTPVIGTSLQTTLFSLTSASVCKDGQGYPSDIVGVDLNGGMWQPCNVNVSNNPCVPVMVRECDGCNQTLNNQIPPSYLPVEFPWNPVPTIYTYLPFNLGDCIYNVDPTGIGENCCWCCACENGLNATGTACNPISAAPPSGSNMITASQPSACAIENMDPGSGDPNTGDFTTPGNTTYGSAWIPCGINSSNNPCGFSNSSSSSITPVSSIGS
tara:strand:+ start:12669 stop:20552 length:7884 start_codon:yes stop_codon:yes gene_type:complete